MGARAVKVPVTFFFLVSILAMVFFSITEKTRIPKIDPKIY